MSAITASVNEWNHEMDGKGQHVVYTVSCESEGKKWTVKRRYNEFDDLNKKLVLNYGN